MTQRCHQSLFLSSPVVQIKMSSRGQKTRRQPTIIPRVRAWAPRVLNSVGGSPDGTAAVLDYGDHPIPSETGVLMPPSPPSPALCFQYCWEKKLKTDLPTQKTSPQRKRRKKTLITASALNQKLTQVPGSPARVTGTERKLTFPKAEAAAPTAHSPPRPLTGGQLVSQVGDQHPVSLP